MRINRRCSVMGEVIIYVTQGRLVMNISFGSQHTYIVSGGFVSSRKWGFERGNSLVCRRLYILPRVPRKVDHKLILLYEQNYLTEFGRKFC